MLNALNKLAVHLYNRYPTVNRGGCCVVAAQMAKHLSKIVPTRISVVGNSDYYPKLGIDRIRSETNNSLDMDKWTWFMSFPHVVVEFKYKNTWYTFDAKRGVVKSKDFWAGTPKKTGSLTLQEAIAFANSGDNWNSMFDRDNIRGLRWRITRFFNLNVS